MKEAFLAPRFVSYFIVAALIGIGSKAYAQVPASWQAWWYNTTALKSLTEPNLSRARDELQKGLSVNGLDPVLHYNMGVVLEQVKDHEKAARHFELAGKLSADPEMQFNAHFNSGVSWGNGKKIPEALRAYQNALAIKADSKEAKTNIELLLSGQGGGGEGGQDDNKDQQDQQQKEGEKPDPNKPYQQKPKNQPRQFKSEELTEQEVRRILDELKRQEEKIRGKEFKKPQKENPNGKDW